MVYTTVELANIILPIADKYKLPAVYLFGSYARGTATEDSDVDLIVDTTNTELKSLFGLGALYDDLETALGKSVDLVTVQALEQEQRMKSNENFKERVLNERVDLYAVA